MTATEPPNIADVVEGRFPLELAKIFAQIDALRASTRAMVPSDRPRPRRRDDAKRGK